MSDADPARSDGRFGIRHFTLEDAVEIHAAVLESQPELGRWMPNLHGGLTVEQARGWIAGHAEERARGHGDHWAIVDAAGALLGGCGLTQFNAGHRFANLYYWVRRSALGRGAASAAARLLARYGLAELGLRRVEIVMSVENLASARVAEKAGAVFEGVLRQRIGLPGGNHDARVYALVASDFAPLRQE